MHDNKPMFPMNFIAHLPSYLVITYIVHVHNTQQRFFFAKVIVREKKNNFMPYNAQKTII